MKVLATCLLLGVVLSGCSGMVKRATSASIFESGKEYVYRYSTAVSAGSEDYVSYASVFNITGHVHLVAQGNQLTAKFTDLLFGTYNGEFQYYPQPDVGLQTYEELNPLQEPFLINLDHGLVTGVTLSGDAPEWAKNIQRGLANTLQIDLNQVTAGQPNSATVEEHTIVGDCKTDYEVIPTDDTHTQVRKYRSHAECSNPAVQKRVPGSAVQHCPDLDSRDVYNSSAFNNFDLELVGGNLQAKKITTGNSVHYFVFGVKGAHQYSFAYTILSLEEVKAASNLGAPSHPETFNDLKYHFESAPSEDEDLTKPTPFYFHQHHLLRDESVQTAAVQHLTEGIQNLIASLRTTAVYKDIKEFHKVNPFNIISDVGLLDYEHLKNIYETLKGDADGLKKKVYLDALVATGTGPAALLIRDIIRETTEPLTIARLFSTLPAYIRNPTENLLKEFEPLLKQSVNGRLEKVNGRLIDFAFASLVKRACKKTGCQSSGLLAKYVQYYSQRFDAATGFEEQTAAVGALRNIGIGGAAEKLLAIVKDKHFDESVRVQALPGLKYLLAKDPKALKRNVLSIFFDRSEHPELRSAVAKYVTVYAFEPEIINQIVLYMWTEKCPLVKNYIYTLLNGAGATTRPCLQLKGSYARTALTFFPPWTVNPKYSANYLSDYYDHDFNFGQMTDFVVHKVGNSFLPSVAYVNINGAVAGFTNSYLTLFFRGEGLGKAVFNRIMDAATQITKFDDIKNVFAKIGVVARTETPLKLEFGLLIQNRVITYHAADQTTLKELPGLLQKLTQRASKSYDVDLLRLTMLGGAMVERATEIGTPVSSLSSVTGLVALKLNVNRGKQGDALQQETDMRFQMNLFGVSGLINHMPALGLELGVTAHRTMRVRQPRHVTLGVDIKQYTLNFNAAVPKEDDPAIAMFHATAITSVRPDSLHRYKTNKIQALLDASHSKQIAVISKGDKYRETRQLGFLHKYLTGVKGGVKYFDCEKVHNRGYVVKQLRKIFGPENKNDGGRLLTKLRLGLSYLRESLFFSPVTQTCGLKAYFYQDNTQQTIFDHVEGQVKVKYQADPNKKLGTKVSAKSALKLVYTGAQPKTRALDLNANFQTTGLTQRSLKLKLGLKDEILNKNGVVCVDVNTQFSKPTDFFAYEGANEPTAERTITIVYGEESKDGKEGSCPDPATSPSIKYVRKSQRSPGQKEVAASNIWPYGKCHEQQASGRYPGPLVPATEACAMAAFEQTKLRQANITVTYKVKPEARNRWRKPGAVLATLLLPYWVPEESVAGNIDDHAAHHGTTEGGLLTGSFSADANFDPGHAEVDVHWHGSHGENEHYHGIDIDGLPLRLINPVSTRFNPIQVASLKLGLYAYCDVTPLAVQTFDNVTYAADLSECETLISADCDVHPRYAVYAHKIAADKLAVTIQLAGSKIELVDTAHATVDGTQVTLGDEIYTLNEKKLFKIFRLDENNVFVSSTTLGVHVRYTGHYTTVTAGSRYRETNCGVCGNFNDDKTDDFTGPDATCKNLRPQDMFKAYIVRDGACSGVGSACPASG